MKRLMILLTAGGLGMTACQTLPATETAPTGPTQPAPPPADASAIPAGTHMQVRLNNELNTTTTRVGDTFSATVTQPLVATNGQVVVPEGAVVTGMVTGVGAPERDNPAALRLNFLRINIDGVSHPLTAGIEGSQLPMDHTDPGARGAVIGAVAGAALGAVITGNLRDALIGAALGAGAGTIISLGMGGPTEAVLPEGTRFTIRTQDRVMLR